jgi:nucleotide-binding universal stress UspA family protein
MAMIKRILLGLGGTPYTDVAIKRAVELANGHGAVITGVTVVDSKRLKQIGPVPPGAGAYAAKLRQKRFAVTEERVDKAIEKFTKKCEKSGISTKIKRETGDPFETMISHARYNDITIFGLKSLFDYGFNLEPRDALIRLVSQGVRPIIAVSNEFRSIRRVLIAYSGSMESAKAMRRYIQLNPWQNVRLRVVHFGKSAENTAQLLKDAGEYCRDHGFSTETALVDNSAKDHLIEYAQQNDMDLIVMGNSIRSLLFRHLLGDTVLSAIQQSDRPLFLAQ